MRVGISVSYDSLIFKDGIVFPVRIAGDVLQAYWIVKYLLENYEVSFNKLSENNDINHLFHFFLPFFGSNFYGRVGFNPNFFNFLLYNIFTSNSLVSRVFAQIFSLINVKWVRSFFVNTVLYFRKEDFFKKNKVYIRKLIENFVIAKNLKYVICNSFFEKREFISFLDLIGIKINDIDFFVINNPLYYQEIDYLLDTDQFIDFEKNIKKIMEEKLLQDYVLFIGRFDRIKNIFNFIKEYKRKRINKYVPLVVLGSVQEYDIDYYKKIKEMIGDGVFLFNLEELMEQLNLLEKDITWYYKVRKLAIEFMRNSKVVIVPSIVESFSFVGLESLYLNKPLIITKNSPYGELFENFIDKSIKLIDPLNIVLDRDYFDFPNFVPLKDYVRENFSVEKIAKAYLEVWRKYV